MNGFFKNRNLLLQKTKIRWVKVIIFLVNLFSDS